MNRAGAYVNNITGNATYQSFRPAPLPPESLELNSDSVQLLIEANRELAKLNTAASLIPSTDLFVSMYVRKEALMTSQIEGTQCTLDDILDPDMDTNVNLDVGDVVNYVNAAQYAIIRLQELPLCNRLLRETHAILMAGVRGQEKNPGEFRRSQNWIGPAGCTLKDARYIPPNVEDMNEAMPALEKYMNEDKRYDALVRVALIHYQFETIHPFLDGNGRIGRLLITLYLIEKKILTTPALYISYFLKKNRIEYYDRMTEVRTKGNYEQWIRFFLQAIAECAEDAITTIDKLTALHNINEAALQQTGRAAKNTLLVFHYLEANPIIDIQKTADALGISFNTTASAVKKLIDKSILVQSNNKNRNRTFAYEAYLDILRDGT